MSHNLENFKITNYEMRKGDTGEEGINTEIIQPADSSNPYGVKGIPGCKECGGSGWKSKGKYPHPCNECAKRTVPVIEKKLVAVIPDPHSGTVEVAGDANKVERMAEPKHTTENRFVPVLYGGTTEEEYRQAKNVQGEHVFVRNDLIEEGSHRANQPVIRTQTYTESPVDTNKTPLYTMSNMESNLPTTTVQESNIIPGSTVPETANTRKKSLGEKVKEKLNMGTHKDEDRDRSPRYIQKETPKEYVHREVYVPKEESRTNVQQTSSTQPVMYERTQPESNVVYTQREDTSGEKKSLGEKVKHALHLDKDKSKKESTNPPEVYYVERNTPKAEYVTQEIHHPHVERDQQTKTQTSMPLYSQYDRNTFENKRNYTTQEHTEPKVYIPQTYDTAGTQTPQNRTYKDDYKPESTTYTKKEVPTTYERKEYIVPQTTTYVPEKNVHQDQEFQRSESMKTNISRESNEHQQYKQPPEIKKEYYSSYYKEVPHQTLTGSSPYPSGIPQVSNSTITKTSRTDKEFIPEQTQTESSKRERKDIQTSDYQKDYEYTHRDTNRKQTSEQKESDTANRSIPTTQPKERVYNIHADNDKRQASQYSSSNKTYDTQSTNKEKLRQYKVDSECEICQGQGVVEDNVMCTGCMKKSGICPECHNTGIKLIGHSRCNCSYQKQEKLL